MKFELKGKVSDDQLLVGRDCQVKLDNKDISECTKSVNFKVEGNGFVSVCLDLVLSEIDVELEGKDIIRTTTKPLNSQQVHCNLHESTLLIDKLEKQVQNYKSMLHDLYNKNLIVSSTSVNNIKQYASSSAFYLDRAIESIDEILKSSLEDLEL